jgi:hypothetical protein
MIVGCLAILIVSYLYGTEMHTSLGSKIRRKKTTRKKGFIPRMIILKLMLKKQDGRKWPRFM